MDVSEFKGIQQFHDGMAVSDYCNTIPLGNSIIDRQGEEIFDPYYCPVNRPATMRVINTFVDSQRNIYIACQDGLRRYRIGVRPNGTHYPQYFGKLDVGAISSNISFCESSTKPSQVFCCTHGRVYMWNTEDIPFDPGQVAPVYHDRFTAFTPVLIPVITSKDSFKNPADGYALMWPEYTATFYNLNDEDLCPKIDRITWFDNRLVMAQLSKNTVWMTEVDPSRWLVPSAKTGYPARTLLDPNTLANTFMPHYYSSTASSARLQDIVAFNGSLYFLNDTSIEVWNATGNAQNPINHTNQNTLAYGGRSPLIIADALYLICRDTIHNDFIVAIDTTGQLKHISNIEIERQLQPGAQFLRPLSVRDQSMFVCYKDREYVNGYSMTPNGYWWRFYNGGTPEHLAWTLLNFEGTLYGVSKQGYLVKVSDQSRKFAGSEVPMTRFVRGAFISFIGRKILRHVNIICDTGIYMDHINYRPQMYLRVSFNRGLSFGPILYRKLGAAGTNNREMVWRNCGSGNSILLEFGTAENVRFQVYGLQFDLK